MKYVKLKGSIVTQVQSNPESGFVEAPNYVVCGMIKDGGNYTEPALTQEQLDMNAKDVVKIALSSITIITSVGNTFDGDSIARADMLSAIIASDTLGVTEHIWKLADNTWKIISLSELKEASALAIQAKGAILASN